MYEGRGSRTTGEALSLIEAGLELLAGAALEPLDPVLLGEDIELIQQSVSRMQLESTRRLRHFDAAGAFRAGGENSAVDWLRDHGRMSTGTALKQVKLARQLHELGTTVEAVESGQVGFEHALELATATSELGRAAESELLGVATSGSPEELRQAARTIRHREDPAAMNDLADEQHRRRRLRLWETGNGMTALEGELTPVSGQRLRLCLESLIAIPAKTDRRSQDQRQADALEELCKRQLAGGRLPSLGGRKPQLTVMVRAETLAGLEGSEPAQLEGSGAIALRTVKDLLGESALRLAIEGKGGVTLNFGRARRRHSEPQRLALVLRHSRCCVDRCTRLARQGQIHHLDEWGQGGRNRCGPGGPALLTAPSDGRRRLVAARRPRPGATGSRRRRSAAARAELEPPRRPPRASPAAPRPPRGRPGRCAPGGR